MRRSSSTARSRSEEHTSELQSPCNIVCRLLLEKKNRLCERGSDADAAGDDQLRLSLSARKSPRFRMPAASPSSFFFFSETATTEIYTLSLHDALPIWSTIIPAGSSGSAACRAETEGSASTDRKSTRLNSSHLVISYAVFCLKKKK